MATMQPLQAEDIARGLRARRSGKRWLARCVGHDDRTPSLSIAQGADGRVLVHCFAGCSQLAVISALAERGLWSSAALGSADRVAERKSAPSSLTVDDERERIDASMRIWREAGPLGSTLGERYFLEHRKLDIKPLDLEHCLRWHDGEQIVVGLMTNPLSGESIGIHRTFLDKVGAKIERKMLGRQGVLRLSPDAEVTMGLGISEGIEDGLGILLSGWAPVWAATSANAIARLPVLFGIGALTVFADADLAGKQAAEACAVRWRAAGREVRLTYPRQEASHG